MMIRLAAAAFGASAALWVAVPRPPIVDVQFELTSVVDSGSYYVYSYRLINPPSSDGGVTAVTMDVSTTSGAPPALAATGGPFRDWASLQSNPAPRAEVGPIIPSGWQAALRVSALLGWYVPVGTTSPDSVPPGAALEGFGIRSSYLPGLRAMSYQPTVEACCMEPMDTTEERIVGFTRDFAIPGWSVGPRYRPDELTIPVLQDELSTICSDPLWLPDDDLCRVFQELLADAALASEANDYEGAASGLSTLLRRVEDNATAFAPTGFWLIRMNLERARDSALASSSSRNGPG